MSGFLLLMLCLLLVVLLFFGHRRRVLQRDSWRLRGSSLWADSPPRRDQDMS